MLDKKGFDLWADGYDKIVELSEEGNEYPFAGYKDLLNFIYKKIHKRDKAKILDLGLGTAVLAKKLYDEGYEIYGLDFSQKMLDIAKEKMPKANLIKSDFSQSLPEELKRLSFDYIIATYALHHLEDNKKLDLIKNLSNHLKKDGKIIIGDIAFTSREDLEKSKNTYHNLWDDEEVYFVFKEFEDSLPGYQLKFTAISHCGGVIEISA